jgi:preprotein translocase subunit SecY
VASLTTVAGAVYLTAMSLIPEVFVASGNALSHNINGGEALIVFCTVFDIRTRVRKLSRTNPGGERR